MKTIYFDCFSGISGDMILGALIDAGLSLTKLRRELAKMVLRGYKLTVRQVNRQGISAIKVDVKTERHQALSLNRMVSLINKSRLTEPVREKALKILKRLGQAEAKVHGTKTVHLHELGSVDTIIDIVGSVVGLDLLGIKKVYASALPLTRGFIKSAHGILPVPAPATAELIRGFPLFSLDLDEELVTPTGAAIITTLAQPFCNAPAMRFDRIGYGAGTKHLAERPNLLRVMLGDSLSSDTISGDTIWVLETNIDDTSPEIIGYLFERLFEAGVLDVFTIPIQTKKSRPALLLKVLTSKDKVEKVESIIFSETTTFGIRKYLVERVKLQRRMRMINTRYGKVKVKIGWSSVLDGGKEIKSISPEYEDCRRLARLKRIPLKKVYEEVLQKAKRLSDIIK